MTRAHREWVVAALGFVAGAATCSHRGGWTAAVGLEGGNSNAPGVSSAAPGSSGLGGSNGPPRFADAFDVSTFLKGNLHTHSLRSDGDSPPESVYAFYRDHGYRFVVLTDHNTRTDPAEYTSLARPGFVMIPGEEVTLWASGKPVHVNALCTKRTIGGADFATPSEALRWAVARVKEQGAVALVNHPNFDWALSAADLPAAAGAELLEIWSGHPHVHSEGDALRPSHEALWAKMLDSGVGFSGVAVDDMHHLAPDAKEPAARPLRAWVQVFGGEATEQAICDGLRRGRLYASSGVDLARLRVGEATLGVTVSASTPVGSMPVGSMSVGSMPVGSMPVGSMPVGSMPVGAAPAGGSLGKVRVVFLGAGGAVLSTLDVQPGEEATYTLRGGERHVRARVEAPNGHRAWTQAYRVE